MRRRDVGLALSGGGYRATLFHLGSLWRLNELGWLKCCDEITGVSGGSIVAAYVGFKWKALRFDDDGVAVNFEEEIVTPLLDFCGTLIASAKLKYLPYMLFWYLINPRKLFPPFPTIGDLVSRRYEGLFGGATLQDFPEDGKGPRITLCSTNLKTGRSFRFSRPYMTDYLIGKYPNPKVSLASAVGASAAFPPLLSPVIIDTDRSCWEKWDKGSDMFDDAAYRSRLYLGDGGIYDNLGVERIWKSKYKYALVSDAGAPFDYHPWLPFIRFSLLGRLLRTLSVTYAQTLALRRQWLIDGFIQKIYGGTYWGINTEIDDYLQRFPGSLMCSDNHATSGIGHIRTSLDPFTAEEKGRLINWGYALADAAMRADVISPDPGKGRWPKPQYLPTSV